MSRNSIKNNRPNMKFAVFALFLMFAMVFSLFALPTVDSQTTPYRKKTFAFMGATPNPLGVGQESLLHFGITDPLGGFGQGWEGLTVTVTRPDGTTETLGPFRSDATGGTGTSYSPSMAGNYTLQSHFPESVAGFSARGIPLGSIYEASDSYLVNLVVTEEPRLTYPEAPLPTEYWTRPINQQHRTWAMISGNWLGYFRQTSTGPSSLINEYTTGPDTGHILWAKPHQGVAAGGLAGGLLTYEGTAGARAFDSGGGGQNNWSPPVIIGGVLYVNRNPSSGGTNVEQEVIAIDLHTGEELWVRNWDNRLLDYGQVFAFSGQNQHSVYGYLWETTGSTWRAFDTATGRLIYTITNVPSGTNVYGPSGEILRYNIGLSQGQITRWNSSTVVGTSSVGNWVPYGNTYNASTRPGIDLNVSIANARGSRSVDGSVRKILFDENGLPDRALGSNFQRGAFAPDTIAMWAISLKEGQEGQLLFNKTMPRMELFTTLHIEAGSVEDGVFCVIERETRRNYGFDLNTGTLLWGPTASQGYLDEYGIASMNSWSAIYRGKYFSGFIGGILYAYDVKTGELQWTYEVTDELMEILWGNQWPMRISFFADGKVYLEHQEHSPLDPLPRGAPFTAVDVETGEKVFDINLYGTQWGSTAVIADGIIAMYNSYDNRIYALGKGPTATTVTASPKVSVSGSGVLIEGTVMDISDGTKQGELAKRFPNGLAAVSDGNMSMWMEYAYMQIPSPLDDSAQIPRREDVTGVDVILSVFDPNNNVYDIGTTTSDYTGAYSFLWEPPVAGKYTVFARFNGSDSYWPSYSETAIGVSEAPEATPAPVAASAPMTDTYILGATAAIIIAIAIVGTLILLMFRKR